MQALKYTLRLMLCWPLLAMLGGIMVLCIALAMIASLFLSALTWQAALLGGTKFGAILAGALWAMFFLKTFTGVSASSYVVQKDDHPDKTSVQAEDNVPSQGDGGQSRPTKQD